MPLKENFQAHFISFIHVHIDFISKFEKLLNKSIFVYKKYRVRNKVGDQIDHFYELFVILHRNLVIRI